MIFTQWSDESFNRLFEGKVIRTVIITENKGYKKYVFKFINSEVELIINEGLVPNIMISGPLSLGQSVRESSPDATGHVNP